jgi:glutathione S-transferase
MAWVAVTIIVALLQYLAFGFMVGGARVKYGVAAPAISGNEVFERYFRVQQNTLEQLVAFVPGIWLFGVYISPLWAAALGAVFIVGRAIYAAGYIRDPKARGAGFGLTFLPNVILLAGGFYGAVRSLLS